VMGKIGDMSIWLAPDDEERPVSIVVGGLGDGMIQSMVPLAEAAMAADMRRLERDRQRRSSRKDSR